MKKDDSNVFFLWLYEGGAGNQGKPNFRQQSSAFFNITNGTDRFAPASTTALSSSIPSTTGTSTSTRSTTNSPLNSVTPAPASTAPSSTATAGNSLFGSASGLSTGGGIGIGVGVSTLGICAAFSTWLFVRKRRGQRTELAPQPDSYSTTLSSGFLTASDGGGTAYGTPKPYHAAKSGMSVELQDHRWGSAELPG